MEYVLVGKLVNTHGIKGEVKIISDFEYKSQVFVPSNTLFIGECKEKVTIKSYRPHKNFDMCVFLEYDYINDILKFKGKKVYVSRDILKNVDYIDSDLIGMDAYFNEECIGVIEDILNNNGYKLLLVSGKYIPYNKNEFISDVDVNKKQVHFKNLEGLI